MSESANDAELGRNKQGTSPASHLLHLLNLGWEPASPLIRKYVQQHGLKQELALFKERQSKGDNEKVAGSP